MTLRYMAENLQSSKIFVLCNGLREDLNALRRKVY